MRTPVNWTNRRPSHSSGRYAVGDVGHIILTHLDLDHAGGLVDFPGATVHVYAEELRQMVSPLPYPA